MWPSSPKPSRIRSKPGICTFLALNDGTADFNANSDSIVEITGFSGALTSLSII